MDNGGFLIIELTAMVPRRLSADRPMLTLAAPVISGGKAPVTCRSVENQVERQLLHPANSHIRPTRDIHRPGD